MLPKQTIELLKLSSNLNPIESLGHFHLDTTIHAEGIDSFFTVRGFARLKDSAAMKKASNNSRHHLLNFVNI